MLSKFPRETLNCELLIFIDHGRRIFLREYWAMCACRDTIILSFVFLVEDGINVSLYSRHGYINSVRYIKIYQEYFMLNIAYLKLGFNP